MQVAKGWGLDCIAGVVIIIAHLKNNFYSSHPSIFAFLDVLISFQTYTYSKIQFANTGMKKLRNDVRNKKETLQKLIENYKINK
jgi:hypothetical protein